MVIEKFTFFSDEAYTGESDVIVNYGRGNTLVLEVTGEAVGLAMSIEGAVDDANLDDWTDLAFTNMGTGSTITSITGNGIYTINVKGITNIRMVIDEITSGSISVIGHLCD